MSTRARFLITWMVLVFVWEYDKVENLGNNKAIRKVKKKSKKSNSKKIFKTVNSSSTTTTGIMTRGRNLRMNVTCCIIYISHANYGENGTVQLLHCYGKWHNMHACLKIVLLTKIMAMYKYCIPTQRPHPLHTSLVSSAFQSNSADDLRIHNLSHGIILSFFFHFDIFPLRSNEDKDKKQYKLFHWNNVNNLKHGR